MRIAHSGVPRTLKILVVSAVFLAIALVLAYVAATAAGAGPRISATGACILLLGGACAMIGLVVDNEADGQSLIGLGFTGVGGGSALLLLGLALWYREALIL